MAGGPPSSPYAGCHDGYVLMMVQYGVYPGRVHPCTSAPRTSVLGTSVWVPRTSVSDLGHSVPILTDTVSHELMSQITSK